MVQSNSRNAGREGNIFLGGTWVRVENPHRKPQKEVVGVRLAWNLSQKTCATGAESGGNGCVEESRRGQRLHQEGDKVSRGHLSKPKQEQSHKNKN